MLGECNMLYLSTSAPDLTPELYAYGHLPTISIDLR